MEFFLQTNSFAHKLFIGSVQPVSYAALVGFEVLRLIVSPARCEVQVEGRAVA